MPYNKRDHYIDFLKFIGLSLIILAHVQAPFLISQVRCFDVPLMLFASGLVFSRKDIDSYWGFVIPRTKRLIYPIYIFLTVLFLWHIIAGIPITPSKIVCSYLLLNTNTIGYVWIIKVFLLMTLLTPAMIFLNKKLSTSRWVLMIFLSLASLEALAYILTILKDYKYIYYIIYEIIPLCIAYAVPFLFGLRYRNSSKKNEITVIGFLFLLFMVTSVITYSQTNEILNLSPKYKYPPRAIFIIYGVMISMGLWYCRRYLSKLGNYKFIQFCGQHTIWIYLWHIPIVTYINNQAGVDWYFKYIIVYATSILCFYVQYRIICLIEHKKYIKFLKHLKN